ncbi:MAG: hypothetical protein ABS35_13495 [Kaistia sp. SCN 65-12]|nr:MAG: hypothetical protein ABS35_13495 [Kaistia sp. SCN 65-12]
MATVTVPAAVVAPETLAPPHPIEWGPVVLGGLAATAISVVLLTFGAALGLSAVSPYPYAGLSAKSMAVLSGTYAALVMVGAFAAGGYLAGRLRKPWAEGVEVERHFRDGAHGFAVWALGVVLGACLSVAGVGALAKGATQAVTAVAAGGASNPAAASLALDPATYAVDRVLAPNPTPNGPAAPAITSRADLAAPMARAFAAGLRNDQLEPRDRTYLAQLVQQQTGISQADAERRVDDAFADLKAAEARTRAAAEAARKAALIAAFAVAATLAIGCAAACAGAALGARHRDENTLVTLFGSRRFW